MKQIIRLEFTNYRAFYGSQTLEIVPTDLAKITNVLIYGENGSGKSSMYEGLKQFFASTQLPIDDNKLARHLKVLEQTQNSNGDTITTPLSIKITFSDETGHIEERVYGIPDTDTVSSTDNFIAKANSLKGFLSYRELLKTHLMDDIKKREFFINAFGNLLVGVILGNHQNLITNQTFREGFDYLKIKSKRVKGSTKEEYLALFDRGLKQEITKINLIINEILHYFDENLDIQIKHLDAYLEYTKFIEGFFPIDLEVIFFGERIDNHLDFLNEARLSSIAIAIYLASLTTNPQNNVPYKLLFLDDIFIGLDMSNRLPLLDILTNFRKPKIILGTNSAGEITQVIEKNEAENTVYESEIPFFQTYQIFITTYDRHWFEVAKRKLQIRENWLFYEMYAFKVKDFTLPNPVTLFEKPIIKLSEDYLATAIKHLHNQFSPDYPSSANYLRKANEEIVRKLMPTKEIKEDSGETPKLLMLKDLLEIAKNFLERINQDVSLIEELKRQHLQTLMNPLSHYEIDTPIYREELEKVIEATQKLEIWLTNLKTEYKEILSREKWVRFHFDINPTEKGYYELKLKEDLYIYRDGTDIKLSKSKFHHIQTYFLSNPVAITPLKFLCEQYDGVEDGYEKAYLEGLIKYPTLLKDPDYINVVEYKDDSDNWQPIRNKMIF